ncbi:MAG: hypothetical protein Q9217_001207 [Psora testacea]
MQVHPGRGLGFIALGASLHEILSRLKSQPNIYTIIDILYSPTEPIALPIILNLPNNGFRLRFDGSDQRLRLVEVLDFSKTHFTYENKDVVKLPEQGGTAKGPAFRHIYDKLIGPTFPGEYITSDTVPGSQAGTYVLSYPGIAFTLPLQESAWSHSKDFVSLLSSTAAAPARSMAIYDGASWQEARQNLYDRACPDPRALTISSRGKDTRPDDVHYVLVRGNGNVNIIRRNSPPFKITLSQTTTQDIVAELGPPDAIYHKSDRRLSIHKAHRNQHIPSPARYEDSTDTDQSSTNATTDESDTQDSGEAGHAANAEGATECFYNYFHHGFDIFISYPTPPSKTFPTINSDNDVHAVVVEPDQLVATKILLHGNIPGSYPFNRHRRCRWVIDAEHLGRDITELNSETPFSTLTQCLQQIWDNGPASEALTDTFKQGMVLNRGWGNSPGSSCELLGGWEESDKAHNTKVKKMAGDDGPGLGNTELFGYPGLVFEVLKNNTVSCLTSLGKVKHRTKSLDNKVMLGPKTRSLPKAWKDTLNLPKSTFPPRIPPLVDRAQHLKRCTDDLYTWQRANLTGSVFTLHDGPPYANGDLHIGHALNKILKDITCRFQLSQGRRVSYVPGWDCHGLPIELKALEEQRKQNRDESGEDNPPEPQYNAVAIRESAKALALKTVEAQKKQFREWAIMADWDNAWKTMDKSFEIKQLEVFKKMVGKGLIYRSFKPVYWSPSTRTALAEAELEYRDDHVSTAAFVKYNLCTVSEGLRKKLGKHFRNIHLVVWTTLPWTLPANKAVGYNAVIDYVVVDSLRNGRLLLARSRVEHVQGQCNESLTELMQLKGSDLTAATYQDVLWSSQMPAKPLLPADHVTADSGSGLAHLAPGHGPDDYRVCLRHGIAPFAPVDENGAFDRSACPDQPSLIGKSVLGDGNKAVLERVIDYGMLLGQHKHTHKYPYDWRSKKPVILRATEQWFANVGDIREAALQSLQGVTFVPHTGKLRLASFIRNRSEWCISRQRAWGVPIPVLYHKDTNAALLTQESIAHIQSVIEERGIDAWWSDAEFDPAWILTSHREGDGQSNYRRGEDTMDVWFDSGTSWTQTLNSEDREPHVADVCLEGSDQHRGWFQSSLLTHIAHKTAAADSGDATQAPFRTLVTHGFVLDQYGHKMSKSLGNVVSPEEIMEGSLLPPLRKKINGKMTEFKDAMGSDALRLWVASCDYTKDAVISPEAQKTTNNSLSKYRTTLRQLLGILHDWPPWVSGLPTSAPFIPGQRGVHHGIALWHLEQMMVMVENHYEKLDYHRAVAEISRYVTVDLSAFYLETIKDAAYCGTIAERGMVQETLSIILYHLLQVLAPITPILVEEAWGHVLPQMKAAFPGSPLQGPWDPGYKSALFKDDIRSDLRTYVPMFMKMLAAVRNAQEQARSDKKMGSSLESYVTFEIYSADDVSDQDSVLSLLFRRYGKDLANILVTSKADHVFGRLPPLTAKWRYARDFEMLGRKVVVQVYAPQQQKCVRCWRYLAPAEAKYEQALCGRCEEVIEDLSSSKPELFQERATALGAA